MEQRINLSGALSVGTVHVKERLRHRRPRCKALPAPRAKARSVPGAAGWPVWTLPRLPGRGMVRRVFIDSGDSRRAAPACLPGFGKAWSCPPFFEPPATRTGIDTAPRKYSVTQRQDDISSRAPAAPGSTAPVAPGRTVLLRARRWACRASGYSGHAAQTVQMRAGRQGGP